MFSRQSQQHIWFIQPEFGMGQLCALSLRGRDSYEPTSAFREGAGS